MTITLDTIKAKQNEIAAMIAAYSAQTVGTFSLQLPRNISIDLRAGEKPLYIIASADGIRREGIVLLPGDSDAADQETQKAWATSIGGRLFNRVEGAFLFSHMKDEFREEAYWTCEQHASNSDYAWYQDFTNGNQLTSHKSARLRARAVRSIPIE